MILDAREMSRGASIIATVIAMATSEYAVMSTKRTLLKHCWPGTSRKLLKIWMQIVVDRHCMIMILISSFESLTFSCRMHISWIGKGLLMYKATADKALTIVSRHHRSLKGFGDRKSSIDA
jgi:hypothetical protein